MPLAGSQGQRNTPVQLVKVAQSLAELRQQTCDEVAQYTSANVKRVLAIS
jgi:Tat protein secretion system quality control protein TatD with DNase activity